MKRVRRGLAEDSRCKKREGKRWRMEGRGGSEDVNLDVQLLSQEFLVFVS